MEKTKIQQGRIDEYAKVLEKIFKAENQLEYLREYLRGLAKMMSQDDINEANEKLRTKYRLEG